MKYGGYTETFTDHEFRELNGDSAEAWFDIAWELALECTLSARN